MNAPQGTTITQAIFDTLTDEQKQVVNAEINNRVASGLPKPTLEEVMAIHPKKWDAAYTPPALSPDAIKAAPPGPKPG